MDSRGKDRSLHLVLGRTFRKGTGKALFRVAQIFHRDPPLHLSKAGRNEPARQRQSTHRGNANRSGWPDRAHRGGEPAPSRDAFGTIVESPAWWEPIMTPIWLEESKPDAKLKDLIAGHVPLHSDRPRGGELTHNTLVYFPDWRADEPLEPVARAMAAMRRRKVSLVLIVVLPEDALDSRRSDLEVKLRAVSSRFAGRLMVTVDQEGGWSRAFAVAGRPSAHLVNARRQLAWNSRGDIEPAAMAAAFDKHILPAPAPRSQALQPKVSGCGCHAAPDITFEDERGQRFALHRMRGRNVILNFFNPGPRHASGNCNVCKRCRRSDRKVADRMSWPCTAGTTRRRSRICANAMASP